MKDVKDIRTVQLMTVDYILQMFKKQGICNKWVKNMVPSNIDVSYIKVQPMIFLEK